jgi:hypothetical protein
MLFSQPQSTQYKMAAQMANTSVYRKSFEEAQMLVPLVVDVELLILRS